MKELYVYTKNLHFIFNREIYIEIDSVALGSPLGLVLANICMVAHIISTYTGIRLHPTVGKWGTLKTLVHRAYETCSTDECL